ncbi:MAG: copper transporter [Peptostreptococcaceae bacterium]|nr:copper transporter [Peptostreptococcaceae bacterium]
MHINMKYYVVSIGAIFIALGIGMLVGFNLNYDQELSKQQATIIEDLDKKFENLKTKNDELETALDSSEKNNTQLVEYINSNYEKIIKDELQDKNIGVITTSNDYDYSEQVQKTIKDATGNILFDIVLNDDITNQTKLKEASDALNINFKNSEDVSNYIVDCLKDLNSKTNLEELEKLGIIKINSISDNYSNYDEVVIATGSSKENKEKVKLVDKTIIEKFKQENKYMVAVQKSDVKTSYMEDYKESKIVTIDNVEEGLGKLSLVTVLKDKTPKGNFGRLEGVGGIIPFK